MGDTFDRLIEQGVMNPGDLADDELEITGLQAPYHKVKVVGTQAGADYSSIAAACAAAASGDMVLVSPGTYAEEPFTIPANVQVDAWTIDTVTIVADPTFPNDDLITLGAIGSIRKVGIVGPSNAYCIVTDGTSALAEEIGIFGGYGGAHSINGGTLYWRHGIIGSSLQYGFEALSGSTIYVHGTVIRTSVRSLAAEGAGSHIYFTALTVEDPGSAFYADNSGEVQGTGSVVLRPNTAVMHTGPVNGTIHITAVEVEHDIPGALDIYQESASGLLHFHNVPVAPERVSAQDLNNVIGYGCSTPPGGDPGVAFWSAVHIGAPGVGRELVVGEGDVTTLGTTCYTYDGVAWVDISTGVTTAGATPLFPDLSAGSGCYIAWNSGSGILLRGIEFDTISTVLDATGGTVELQYWNGAAWVKLSCMVTDEATDIPYAEDYLQVLNGSEHIRFNPDDTALMVASDPMSFGENLYWIRLQITAGPITTIPEVDLIKMVPTRTRWNESGWREMDGAARIRRLLPWSMDGFQIAPTGIAPGSTSVYTGANIAAGPLQNTFTNGNDCRTARFDGLPYDCDTSGVVRLHLDWAPSTALGGNVDWHVYWSFVPSGGIVGLGAPPAVSLYEGHETQSVAAPTTTGERIRTSFDLDITRAIPRRVLGGGDILYIMIRRDGAGDAYAGSAVVLDVAATYLSWGDGSQS